MSEPRKLIPFRCTFGHHTWGKWQDGTLEQFRINDPTIKFEVIAQVRYCQDCRKREICKE